MRRSLFALPAFCALPALLTLLTLLTTAHAAPPLAADRAAALAKLAPEDYALRTPWLDRVERCAAAEAVDRPDGCDLQPAIVGVHPDGRVALLHAPAVASCADEASIALQILDPQLRMTHAGMPDPKHDPKDDPRAFYAGAWRWMAGLRARGFQPAPDLITATVEQPSGIRSHTPLAVLGASGGWIVDAVSGPKAATVRLIDPDQKGAQVLGTLANVAARCDPQAADGMCADATYPGLLQIVRAPDGESLLALVTMGDGSHCGSDPVRLVRWPLPGGALRAEKPAPAPKADVAVVLTPAGLFAVTIDGAPPKPLPTPPGERSSCMTDPRAGGVWIGTGDGSGPKTLHFVDLEGDGGVRRVVEGIPALTEPIVIDHGAAGRLGGHDPVTFGVGFALRMRSRPVIEAEIGCKGDGAWYCYDDDQVGAENPRLQPELEARREAIAALKPIDRAWLATLAQRAGQRPLWRTPKVLDVKLPIVEAVPKEKCQAHAEACGTARPVPGTPYWRVVTANERGDFYYQEEQLFDPASKMFFDLGDPSKRSPTPLPGSESVEGLQISPSSLAYATYDRVARFDGEPVQMPPDAGLCGWTGPAVRLGGPRE